MWATLDENCAGEGGMDLGEAIGAEEGVCASDLGVGERDEAVDRSNTTVAVPTIAGLGLLLVLAAAAPDAPRLPAAGFGSKFLIASADAGRWPTSLSSAAIIT